MDEEDTGRIVHVRLWCVKVGVSAEQLWDQRQHQRWMTSTQELKTPEQREKNNKMKKKERASDDITNIKPLMPDVVLLLLLFFLFHVFISHVCFLKELLNFCLG